MDTVVITFNLVDMTHARYEEVCAELAPAFAALPGLLAKIWLADAVNARYGGVYLFVDAESADTFAGSALARTVAEYPHFAEVTVRRFVVDEASTGRTQPGLAIVAPAPAVV